MAISGFQGKLVISIFKAIYLIIFKKSRIQYSNVFINMYIVILQKYNIWTFYRNMVYTKQVKQLREMS